MRGSDPNGTVYWLARMVEAGEDPKFIARRMLILASEDIGNAEPYALSLATAAMQSVHNVGMPEARIILSQVTTYLASCAKSNAAYLAIDAASSPTFPAETAASIILNPFWVFIKAVPTSPAFPNLANLAKSSKPILIDV